MVVGLYYTREIIKKHRLLSHLNIQYKFYIQYKYTCFRDDKLYNAHMYCQARYKNQ